MDNSETKYDVKRPLLEQIAHAKKVVIDYQPNDPDINTFVREMDSLCKRGVGKQFHVEIAHNNHMKGIKTKKQLTRLVREIQVNEAIKLLVTLQHHTENALEELVNFCKRT